MFKFIETYQLDIMLALSAACLSFVVLLFFTRFLDKSRRIILIALEITAMLLLYFDRMAYVYRGDVSHTGYVLVRLSNFFVFFLTSQTVFVFDLYLIYLLSSETRAARVPRRLYVTGGIAAAGMLLAIIAHFTGLYYYFDENNVYHRGPGFLICYIIPVLCPLIQYTVVRQYKKTLSKLVYTSLVLYIFVPIAFGVIQIFAYGISIVNMAMVLVSISLYIFTYLDVNDEVVRAHEIEMEDLKRERKNARKLFDETATAFVAAIEKRDAFSEGHSKRVAEYSKQIAEIAGKTKDECEEVYYAGLLHDVGLVGIPDSILKKQGALTEEEELIIKERPIIGGEILSNISHFKYLKDTVTYSHERYDGSGYPEGRKGKEIPEYARIVAVADAFDSMTKKNRYRDSLPYLTVRERFVTNAGISFDPKFSEIMVELMDKDSSYKEDEDAFKKLENEITVGKYREVISTGIHVKPQITKVNFKCEPKETEGEEFSLPSLVIFDSFDRRVHDNEKAIGAYHYLEYGELWFDGHYVSTGARNMEVHVAEEGLTPEGEYYLEAARFEDHFSLKLRSHDKAFDVIMALPDKSKSVYIGLTGENCRLYDISAVRTEVSIGEGDIKKIVNEESFIDRLESDIKNIQIDRSRSDATEGIRILDAHKIEFHTLSLPSASFIWHCPYIVIYSSEDKKVFGEGYREYSLIKINGECTGEDEKAKNHFSMKKDDDFKGWENWKAINKQGMECSVRFNKRGNKVILMTENLGIHIENETTIPEDSGEVYIALTGDQVALTDIRVR